MLYKVLKIYLCIKKKLLKKTNFFLTFFWRYDMLNMLGCV